MQQSSSSRLHEARRGSKMFAVSQQSTTMQQLTSPTRMTTLLVACLLVSSAVALSSPLGSSTQQEIQQQEIQASFSTASQDINITHVTYDPLHDTVYLGATNNIYQLNGSDLKKIYEHSTGPTFDSPACGIKDCSGFEENMKPTTNVNKVLVIDYQHKKLLSCGSVKQGACRRYELNNIGAQPKADLIPIPVAANDDNSSTYAFIAPARFDGDGAQQQVLYVGTTYTKFSQSRDLQVPAIGTRILQQGPELLKLYERNFDIARTDISSHLRDYFLVNYLYGFASSNYIYFVTVQKKATTRDYEELGYHTRLARICITDSSYNSYTEVDLKCVPNRIKKSPQTSKYQHSFYNGATANGHDSQPSEYPLLQDAILVDAGSQLLQSLAQNDQSSPLPSDYFYGGVPAAGAASPDDSKVLLGVFSSAKDHTQHAGEHSALCAFSLSQIEEKFNENINSCFTGKMQFRNMEYIAGNVQECPKSAQAGNIVNYCRETLKINGTLPIVSEASLQLYNTTITAITATSHVNTNQKNIYSEQLSNEFQSYNTSRINPSSMPQSPASPDTVVFMGTSSGHLKKVLLNNASNGIEFDDVQLDSNNNPILGDLHLDASGQHVIAATPYKVMKVAVQNCGKYATCRECSQSRNPYCGWCSSMRSCTSKAECLSAASAIETRELPAVGRQQQPATQAATDKQLKWISSESAGKCIDLQSIVPDKIPITSTQTIDLHIDRLQRSGAGGYKCIFDKREQTVATQTALGLNCPLPQTGNRPKIQPGKDHVVVELSVRSSETNTDFLNGKVTFFDCQQHKTCLSCLSPNWGCNWCMVENLCLPNTMKCDKTAGLANVQDQRANGTTQAPLITISNASNSRIALSLKRGEDSSSTLVASNQRMSNTIRLVSQCPGYDLSLFKPIVDSQAETVDSNETGSNRNSKNTQQQQSTTAAKQDTSQQQQTTRRRPTNGNANYSGRTAQENRGDDVRQTTSQRYYPNERNPYLTTTVMTTISRLPPNNVNNSLQEQSLDSDQATSNVGYEPLRPMIDQTDGSDRKLYNWPISKQPAYHPTQYTVRQEGEPSTLLQQVSSYVMTVLTFLVYLTLAMVLSVLVYSGFVYGCRLRHHSYRHLEYRGVLAKMNMLEKSLRNECRIASMSLRSDLNELTRHVDLSGIPLLDFKHHVMKVFFPGINNHPLLVKSPSIAQSVSSGPQSLTFSPTNLQQQQNLQQKIQRPIKNSAGGELPMEYFERLILTKPFLVAFINTLERQPTFTIRDRVNVASLIMIVLMDKLDYATDILRTLLFQLVERSVETYHANDGEDLEFGAKSKSRFSQHASNLLGGLPISKRSSRTAKLGRVVGGSASSLMASTQVAAQAFISRVGHKTSPLDPNPSEFLTQQNSFNSMSSTLNHSMSTTAFNQQHQLANTISGRAANRAAKLSAARRERRSPTTTTQSATHLMLRRTDSIVEKMLTDWLALNMYEHFHGDIGHSLYMMFEALKCQIERGPVDAISGEAYYSLNEHKLLKEPFIQFEIINLYVIVDTEILQSGSGSHNNNDNNTASLIDTSLNYGGQPLYGGGDFKNSTSNYTSSAANTITLAVRVLDCDTISQVKAKILSALYRNSPQSGRVGVDGVELILRQHQSMHGQSTMSAAAQYSTVSLCDEDYSSLTAGNGTRRVNTLKHYGVTDQAIVVLNRCRQVASTRAAVSNRTALTDMLDEHYNNPYSEIQYGPLTGHHQQAALDSQVAKSWHLVRSNDLNNNRNIDLLSSDSSSSSHSPSMMLLGNESQSTRVQTLQNTHGLNRHPMQQQQQHQLPQQQQQQQQQQYYHPSDSSTSSSGNVMDTNSTSANSSSVNVTNLMARSHHAEQQPIYCQIGSSARSQAGANSSYYYQVGGAAPQPHRTTGLTQEQEKHIYLTRMLISKGTVQGHIDEFFKTILNVKSTHSDDHEHLIEQENSTVLCPASSRANLNATGACPPAVKWLFDLLDEAADRAGIADQSVVHAWKSNAFLLRFWVNFIKNPDYIMDIEKSGTMDATLSVVAQTLMDSCSTCESKLNKDSTCNKLLFAKNIPKYQGQVKRFYQDVASMRPVSDQEIVKHMSSLSALNAGRFDTNLALKELCVYAVNYGVDIMGALNDDQTCQQMGLSQQLEQCFRSFTFFEAYR